MKKAVTLAVACVMVAGASFAQIAQDQASNYTDWASNDNEGTGFGPWSLSTSGDAGSGLFGTAVGDPSFGLWSESGGNSTALRPFAEALNAGDEFSFNVGHTANIATGAEIGFTFWSDGAPVLTWKFVGGEAAWLMNDGGSDFGAGQDYAADTSLAFSLTYEGGDFYSYTFGTGSGSNFEANNDLSAGIDAFSVFNSGQGGGENIGFDNIEIIPEPGTIALLALGILGLAGLRRRIAK